MQVLNSAGGTQKTTTRKPVTMVIFTSASEVAALCKSLTEVGVATEVNVDNDIAKTTLADNDLIQCALAARPLLVDENANASRWRVVLPGPTDPAGHTPTMCLLRQLRERLLQHTDFVAKDAASPPQKERETHFSGHTSCTAAQTPFLFHVRRTDTHVEETSTVSHPTAAATFLWANTENEEDLQSFLPSSMLCIDVGGLYTAVEDAASELPAPHKRQKSAAPRSGQEAVPQKVNASTQDAVRAELPSQSLSLHALLQSRFCCAQTSMPFDTDTEREAYLAEVWVVPLDPSSTPQNLSSVTSIQSSFPSFVEVGRNNVAQADAPHLTRDSSLRPLLPPSSLCVRLTQLPPDLRMPLPQYDGQQSSKARKRPRQEGEGGDASPQTITSTFNGSPLSTTKASAMEMAPLSFRVVEKSFLDNSCYFSRWCCPADFEVAHPYTQDLSRSDVKTRDDSAEPQFRQHRFSQHHTTQHAFYAALQRAITAAEPALLKAWEVTWHSNFDDAGQCEEPVVGMETLSDELLTRRARPLLALLQPKTPTQPEPAEDLFDECDTALRGAREESTNGSVNEQRKRCVVWPVGMLWTLWTRLGWAPPPSSSTLSWRVQLDGASPAFHTTPADGLRFHDLSSRSLTGEGWAAFVARCIIVLDDAYVQERLAGHGERSGQGASDCDSADGTCTDEEEDADAAGLSCDPKERKVLLGATRDFALVRFESLATLRRTFAAQAAVLERGADFQPLQLIRSHYAESLSKIAAESPRTVPPIVHDGARTRKDTEDALRYVSPAAQALAADIAATTPSDAPPAAMNPREPGWPALFSEAWASAVLEAPGLPFAAVKCEADAASLANTANGQSLRSLFAEADGSRALAWEQHLQSQQCAALSQTYASTPASDIHASSTVESFCEMGEMAELRWRAGLQDLDVSSPGINSACTPQKMFRKNAQTHCGCCCARACEAAAEDIKTLKGGNMDRGKQPVEATPKALADPLAELLRSSFLQFVVKSGVHFAAASDLTAAATTSDPALTESRDGNNKHDEKEEDAEDTPQTEYQNTIAIDSLVPALPSSEALTAIFTNTIVRAVQQNKAVVRRLLQLVQSYENTARGGAGEHSLQTQKSHPDAEDSLRSRAATKTGGAETSALTVWHCLSAPKTEEGTEAAEGEGDCASAAKRLAARQLQSFWADVAALTRRSVLEEFNALDLVKKVEGKAEAFSGLEENASQISNTARDVSVTEPVTACGKEDRASTCSASPATQVLSFAAGSASERHHDAVRVNSFAPDALRDFTDAVLELDGERAMRLYMRHILRCTVEKRPSAAPTKDAQFDAQVPELQNTIPQANRLENDAMKRATSPTYAELLQPHKWLQHALFMLSYGFAGLSENSSPSATTSASAPVDAEETPREPSFNLLSPHLATFRVLRSGKLTLDAWILAALEEYATRWRQAVQRHATAERRA